MIEQINARIDEIPTKIVHIVEQDVSNFTGCSWVALKILDPLYNRADAMTATTDELDDFPPMLVLGPGFLGFSRPKPNPTI
jgi:transketolase N-terminal domain/subunit